MSDQPMRPLKLNGPLPTAKTMPLSPQISQRRWARVRGAIGLLNKHYYDHHITRIIRKTYSVGKETAELDLRVAREILARHYGKSREQVKVDLLAAYDALIQNQHTVERDDKGRILPSSEPPVPYAVRLAALNSKAQIMGILRPDRNVNVNISAKLNVRHRHKTVIELVQSDPKLRDGWLQMSRMLRGGESDQ